MRNVQHNREHFIMYALTSSDGYIKGKHLVTQTVLM